LTSFNSSKVSARAVKSPNISHIRAQINGLLNVQVELGELQICYRKISKFLVVPVLSNSPWLPRDLKKCPKWNN